MQAPRKRVVVVAVVWALCACSSGGKNGTSARPATSASSAPAEAVASAAASAAASASAAAHAAEWEKVKLEDEVPLCVFGDPDQRDDAKFLRDVHKQTLHANDRVVFGTFPPDCLSPACLSPPSHQCWVDSEEPNTLVVHSRLSYERKRGAVCTEGCEPVIAGCRSEVLKAGKYTVKYGAHEYSLRVPSVLKDPCFKRE